MALSAGTRLGPYEVLSAIGAGGMGEVYRARDTRLERTVAVKVLPPHLSPSPEVRQRFEREAKLISQLSHPHICALYDVGREGETEYLVMEYLEGETMAQRLVKGPVPADQLLRWGVEIADALDKAHQQGIVHRDLKPGNVMLTKPGVKLLDFGLAKAMAAAAPAGSLTSAPTTARDVTREGTILGTMSYMAPEQLEGKGGDARTDIFALGATLYEMATGAKAFSGASQASLITAIMSAEPAPISTIQAMTPPALDGVVKRCLAKSPDDRWQSAADVKHALEWVMESARSAVGAVPRVPRRKPWRILAAAAAVPVLVAAGFLWGKRAAPRSVAPVVRFALPPGEPLALAGTAIAFSPDGRRIVSVVRHGDTTQLSLHDIASSERRLLPGTEGASLPFFSPDGEWIGFFADGRLKKTPPAGGPAIVLCRAPEAAGGTWLPDGTIVFNADWREGLLRVSAAGGAPEVVTHPDAKRGEFYHWTPEALPGGGAVLFTDEKGASGSLGEASVAALSVKAGTWRTVIEKGSNPHYVSSGHIVYEHEGALLAAPFDADRLRVTGPSVPVLAGALTDPNSGAVQVAVSRTGSVAFVSGTGSPAGNTLVVLDREGKERPLTELTRPYEDLALSPDGRFLALTLMGEPSNVWLYDLARGTLGRFTFQGDNRDPIWTSDSRRVIYVSSRHDRFQLFWKPIDGSGAEEELLSTEKVPFPYSCSRDDRWFSYEAGNTIYLLPLAGERKPRPVLSATFAHGGAISPDGKWIAYESGESGQSEVYVRSLSSGTGQWQVSAGGGLRPHWSPDGSELFFRSGSQGGSSTLMSVPIQTGPAFSGGTPRPLFKFRYIQGGHDFAVMPDGQHFICIKEPELEAGSTQVNVILNWAPELRK